MLKRFHRTAQRNRKRYYAFLGGLGLGGLFLYLMLVQPVWAFYQNVQALEVGVAEVRSAWEEKNYARFRQEQDEIETNLKQAQANFTRLGYLAYLPWIGTYYQDGEHFLNSANYALVASEELINAAEPFKEVFGFTSQTQPTLTTEERLTQLVQVMPGLLPALEDSAKQINSIRDEISKIDPGRYPENISGLPVRAGLSRAQDYLNSAEVLLKQVGPVLRSLPAALGEPTPQNYLILFQNDKELRPTGGFITAFALVELNHGQFRVVRSDNIYQIDPENALLPAPRPILDYLYVPAWHMRDTNFSPDFLRSMQDFEAYLPYTDLPSIRGIIAVDTHFLEALMGLTGPINLPGYNLDFSGQDNLPESCRVGGRDFTKENVVCRLELYTQRILLGRNGRKDILGDLMGQLVERLLNSDSVRWFDYFEIFTSEAEQKHILFSLHEPALQSLVEAYNWAGRIRSTTDGTDYLHVNDANLAGLKADMYLIREVLQNVEIARDGTVTKTLTLIYNNPEPQDGWLNAVARNYVRVYVPKGSELIEFSGDVTRSANTWEELGKTVFDNFVLVPPLQVKSVTVKYRLPFKLAGDKYKLFIQKQPGKDVITHEIKINGEKHTENVYKDVELQYYFD